ncbi:hypothetical protein BMETH_1701_1 [methanotrophic bacterial endosymbiont of Bathymodiolus sp.]|nr:hypothetical protein BMETH_1701_1 [methanotrophic bacterial endosymbiont of Bathymodiolus sp.]
MYYPDIYPIFQQMSCKCMTGPAFSNTSAVDSYFCCFLQPRFNLEKSVERGIIA